MNILLVNPPDNLAAVLGRGANLLTPFEPLGLLYLAAVLQQDGHEVSVVDAAVERLDLAAVVERIRLAKPDIVGVTTFTSNGAVVYALGKEVKRLLPEITVVLGNIHASVYAEQYLRHGCCDIVIHGEGEESFADLVQVLAKGSRDFATVPAASYLKDGAFVTNPGPHVVADLTSLPFPARDLLDQRLYNIPTLTNMTYSAKKGVGKHLFTSRGCPNRCTFCVVHHSAKQRYNSVQRVVDEMELLQNRYQASYLFLMDSLFISNKQRVMDICAEIKNRGLAIRWGCEAHVRFIDQELLAAMESAGCHDMAFGIESGVQRLLDNVRKNIRLDQVAEAVRLVKRHSDIKVSGLFILGLPGETEADTLQTISFAKSLPLDMAQFSMLVPYPGSQLFNDLRERGEIDDGLRPDGTLDTSVWERYSAYISYTDNLPIWVTKDLTGDRLKRLQKRALREFYFRPRHLFQQARRIRLSQLPTMIKTAIDTFF